MVLFFPTVVQKEYIQFYQGVEKACLPINHSLQSFWEINSGFVWENITVLSSAYIVEVNSLNLC